MNIVNVIYRAGDNRRASLQWEVFDTPPAQAWKRMLEYVIEQNNSSRNHLTEANFCSTETEAKAIWLDIRSSLAEINHNAANLPFAKLKKSHALRLLKEFIRISSEGNTGDLELSYKVKTIIDKTRRVLFYLDFVKDAEMISGNEGSAFGMLIHHPDPPVAMAFDPAWFEHLTLNTEPGTVYAELGYVGESWANLLHYENFADAYPKIGLGTYCEPSYLSGGFQVHFEPDRNQIQVDLSETFFNHYKELKHMIPDFDPVRALNSCGRMPVARLLSHCDARTYEDLKNVDNIFKLELLDYY